jgi:hypothetical protein
MGISLNVYTHLCTNFCCLSTDVAFVGKRGLEEERELWGVRQSVGFLSLCCFKFIVRHGCYGFLCPQAPCVHHFRLIDSEWVQVKKRCLSLVTTVPVSWSVGNEAMQYPCTSFRTLGSRVRDLAEGALSFDESLPNSYLETDAINFIRTDAPPHYGSFR